MSGDSFILNCTPVSSNPQPTGALFYFNSSQLSGPWISESVLTISSIKREERGVYSCTVNNTVGSVTAEVTVNVLGELIQSMLITIGARQITISLILLCSSTHSSKKPLLLQPSTILLHCLLESRRGQWW